MGQPRKHKFITYLKLSVGSIYPTVKFLILVMIFFSGCGLFQLLGSPFTNVGISTVLKTSGLALLPLIPLGLFLILKTLFHAIVGRSNIISTLLLSPIRIPIAILGFIKNIIMKPITFIGNGILSILYLPFEIISSIVYLPVVILHLIFDVLDYIVSLPFNIVIGIVKGTWKIFMNITYILRLPFIILFEIPPLNVIYSLITFIPNFVISIMCSFIGLLKSIFRFIFSIPGHILVMPIYIIKFFILLPVRIILFPIFIIDILFTIVRKLVVLPFNVISWIYRILMPSSLQSLIELLTLPITIPISIVLDISKVLLIPHYIIKYFFF